MAVPEKLGSFYLGKEFDIAKKQLLDQVVNYDSRDLTTHAVCVGMTGSGKTGLCVDLLEEAAIDGVPAIIIDPKGDVTNLLLTFPELRPEDFRPWINEDDARRKGMEPDQFAAVTAQTWRDGLAKWDQGPERIQRLKDAAEFVIYTPGSEAGVPVSILNSFQSPQLDWDTESEILRDRVQGMVSALLGLIGVEADPIRSREHILLSTIIETAWRNGEDLDLGKLIVLTQNPPFGKLGVFDLDSFYPAKERFSLAMMLNSIVASPSFSSWLKGQPIDIGAMLHSPGGKPRHSIFYIAHLNDAERMFFVTILLEHIISWMRSQPGTTSLRALLYMDEVFGFFPPVAEPPSKRPMLTLLKQARAFGLGVMLTTQNPVDLDYKGLTNAGTWFIGKLQAERDKTRLLEGLQSAMSEAGTMTDSSQLEKIISSLDSRVFLLHDINLSRPVVFSTRWALSYLRGPLTRQQIKLLTGSARPAPAPVSRTLAPGAVAPATSAEAVGGGSGLSNQPPLLPPDIKQVYLPVAGTAEQACRQISDRIGAKIVPTAEHLTYGPALLGFASVRFADRKLDLDSSQDFSLLLPLSGSTDFPSWQDAEQLGLGPRDVDDRPAREACFPGDLPGGLSDARGIAKQSGELVTHLFRTQALVLPSNPTLKLTARVGESQRDFVVRCQQVAREGRDAEADKLKDKYEAQLQRIQDRLEHAQSDVADSQRTYQGRQAEEVLSGVASVAGMLGLFGRRRTSLTGLSSAATKRRLSSTAKANIAESQAEVARLKAQLDDLKSRMEADATALSEQWAKAAANVQEIKIPPRKTDIQVQSVTVAWAPNWEISYEDARGRARTELMPAYARSAPG